jgi:arylsulfatase A-like enzyme
MDRALPNVLLVTIDSLRFDHLSCYGYARDTSPNIDKLATAGTLFSEAISSGGGTPSAFPSILASALPPINYNERKTIMQHHTTLAEVLRKSGYSTAAFNSNPFLTRLYGYNKGVDKFEEGWDTPKIWVIREWLVERVLSRGPSKSLLQFLAKLDKYFESIYFTLGGHPTFPAEQISAQAISWLSSQKSNFFLWLHYMSVHNPYMPPQKYIRQLNATPVSRHKMSTLWRKLAIDPKTLSPAEMLTVNDLYDASIKYVDDAIGQLLDKAGKKLKNTIIIITGDHGDEFGEHGKAGHMTLYDGIVHVPLIISGPGIEAGDIVKEQVGLIDLAPTIIDLIGLGKVQAFRGESLLPMLKGKPKVSRGIICAISPAVSSQEVIIAYRTPEWKYIRTESTIIPDTVLTEEFYHLKDDPREKVNLAGLETAAAQEFKAEAAAALAELKKTKTEELTALEKERVKRKLGKIARL